MEKNIMDKADFSNAIDNLNIFAKDYATITKLMDNLDDALFVKILEEVLEGNLYWSDFEEIFSNTGYETLLRTNIPLQEKINRDINNYISLRRELGFSVDSKKMNIGINYTAFSEENEKQYQNEYELLELSLNGITTTNTYINNFKEELLNNTIFTTAQLKDVRRVIVESDVSDNDKSNILNVLDNLIIYNDTRETAQFYKDEYENMRDNHLYNLTQFKASDSLLVRTCKDRLYNAIMNGRYLDRCNISFEGDENVIKNAAGEKIATLTTDYNIKVDDNTYEYININDILLSLDHGVVPIGYEYQKLDDVDVEFMRRYNLSEDTMKQFKSLNTFFRRKDFIEKFKEDL